MNQHLVAVMLFVGLGVMFGAVPLILSRLIAPRKPGPVKSDIYECGTQTVGDPWVQFGVQYYVYALLFVLFDVEVVFFFPWAVVFKSFSADGRGLMVMAEMGVFLVIVVVGLVYAWGTRTLEWE